MISDGFLALVENFLYISLFAFYIFCQSVKVILVELSVCHPFM